MNSLLCEYAAFILQPSQAYNVPSESVTFDNANTDYPDRTPYSQMAISRADNFNDGNTTIRDVFDIVAKATPRVSYRRTGASKNHVLTT